MKRDEHHAPISAGLPILDEIGEVLHREFVRRERDRRRRQKAAGALMGVIAAAGLAAAALVGVEPERARAIEIATGRAANADWRLVLIESDSGPCLQLRPRYSPGGNRACPIGHPRLDRPVARARIDGQAFVYGFSNPAAPPVRLGATGRIQYLKTKTMSPSTRDTRYRAQASTRSITTQALPPKVRAKRLVPGSTRVFVAAIPSGRDRAVIVEPAGSEDNAVVIRVANATPR